MPSYIELTLDIVGEAEPQRAKVRDDLPVADLVAEIARKFEISDREAYALYRTGQTVPLNLALTLPKQDVSSGDQLTFTRPALLLRQPITVMQKAALHLIADYKVVYDIQWQPAVIGRPSPDATQTSLLAVNLEWVENNRRISRQHAQITESDGTFFIESLSPNNPTFLNSTRLQPNEKYPLSHGDLVVLKASRVRLEFVLSDA